MFRECTFTKASKEVIDVDVIIFYFALNKKHLLDHVWWIIPVLPVKYKHIKYTCALTTVIYYFL